MPVHACSLQFNLIFFSRDHSLTHSRAMVVGGRECVIYLIAVRDLNDLELARN
jgi:hypothetical protein